MLGNGVVGILSESTNKWERRVPLTPSHCARLLHSVRGETGVARIIVQPSTKRIHHDALYEDVGCEISDDLSECGLILGIKQPKLEMILPDRAYAFFSHTHKVQKENMPLLDKILAERASLFDYELIVGDNGKRQLAFGKFAGRAGLIDFLRGLGQRYLNLGFSTPFLSLGASYMYPSLAAAKAAVIAVGEEIATFGLPSGISPLVFVFTGSGNVSLGAQEIFKLLPHSFIDPSRLPDLFGMARNSHSFRTSKRVFQVYGCVVTCQDMVEPKDPTKPFDKADYYAHPEHYRPVFHEKIAPYASVIVNCMYWEKRFPRLLTTKQLQELMRKGCPLVGISDITCDIGGSIGIINQCTLIDSPFFRYDPSNNSYHHDMDGNGLICLAVDILPTEFAKEASQHFGDILSQFIGSFASIRDIKELPAHLRRACIAHGGVLTSLYEYIPRMRSSDSEDLSTNLANCHSNKKKYNILVGADDSEVLDQIIDSLTSIASPNDNHKFLKEKTNMISLKVGRINKSDFEEECDTKNKTVVLILGAGRVCRPAVEFLTSIGSITSQQWLKTCMEGDFEEKNDIQVIVASLYLQDAEEITEGIANATAVQLDIMDHGSLCKYISQVKVVISLLPPRCHRIIADACIELRKHLITASYVDDSMSKLDGAAKTAGITILGEMGLDPGIDHMMAMKIINQAHVRRGRIKSFTSYCGGLPSPVAANNPLAYKFSWNPAGAILSGRNSATYRSQGVPVHVDGNDLYDSAVRFRIPELPAFALECLPNRNSLIYGDLYGIGHEALTIFRGTLRYEGFAEIMGTLARIGFFNTKAHPILENEKRPKYVSFLLELLSGQNQNLEGNLIGESDVMEKIFALGFCKEQGTAAKTAKTIIFLGLHEETEIPLACRSAFEVICLRMEERLAYSSTEQDMVLLHHEVEVDFPDGRPAENHRATLLEFGSTNNGKTTTAMAFTVGIPAAIGALLLLADKIKTRGVLRPIEPEVYVPALDILQAYGIKLMEKMN
ncbi:alpha-aminoadipic semialdehyde synthase-like isoform X1 [Actinidia eriantha]|uniref:alpha-aminoadipic semialdehyde synthase-like isoform X1 n=1 Tax=Actinidia eriantha TaxID=165200 RepID=UPI00258A85E4|nr:alpha-aminoadipic semialdehyde synthase-like isoform X1 [Actinidia eriantha]XP_057506465.1 alpha-aminoadipic semialdehyde synthase-like isoform X1 [Actinidia eriantha]